MSMDPSMIKGTGLLELIRPGRKPKTQASGKASKPKRKAKEDPQVPAAEATPDVVDAAAISQGQALSSPYSRAYLRFLAFEAQSAAKARSGEGEAIDANEKALLELIILRWAVGAPMTVRQAIALTHLGSPATLHKRLMRLRNKTYLGLDHVSGDRRVKRLVLGAAGQVYLETMGRHLMAARQSGKKSSA